MDISRGLASFAIVGLPDAAVRESRERIRSSMPSRSDGLLSAEMTICRSWAALVAEFQDKSLSGDTRDGVGAVLACRQQIKSDHEGDWRSFSVSRWRADQAIRQVQAQLDEYELENSEYPVSILSPANIGYDCYAYSGD